jgi:hypothetical protein
MPSTCWFRRETTDQAGNSPTKTVILTVSCVSRGRDQEASLGWKIHQGKGKSVVCRLEMVPAVRIDPELVSSEEKIDLPPQKAVDQDLD